MPTFECDNIYITPEEFVSSCSKIERNKLINVLKEYGYIIVDTSNGNDRITNLEETFENHLDSLRGKWNRLTQEDEETILKIAKKFK